MNRSLVTGLRDPEGIVVTTPSPEPSTLALLVRGCHGSAGLCVVARVG